VKLNIHGTVEDERSGNPRFVLSLNGRRLFAAKADRLRALSQAIQEALRTGVEHGVGKHPNNISVRIEGPMALWIQGGQLMFEVAKEYMQELQSALHNQAGRLEEIVERERIVSEGALLARTGSPIGITDNPILQSDISNYARDDRTLRRALPGVQSAFVAGVPRIVGGTLTRVQRALRLRPEERHALLARIGGSNG